MIRQFKSRSWGSCSVAVVLGIAYCLASATSVAALEAVSETNINAKVARLDIDTAGLDDVIRIFGEPKRYSWTRGTFTKDNLPSTYIAWYSDSFRVLMSNGMVSELRFVRPEIGYVYEGKLQIDSSLDEVFEVVGKPTETVVGHTFPSRTKRIKEGVLYKDLNGKEGHCYYKPLSHNVRFLFRRYKVSSINLGRNTPIKAITVENDMSWFTRVRPLLDKYDNVCFKDMSMVDLSACPGLPATLTFNQKTVWPVAGRMPAGEVPGQLLKKAMNPGLGIRKLHKQGITGKGVNVAIIDQAMYLDHPEFAGKIAAYHYLGGPNKSSMHGPAVTSLLVGTNCGTAPDARIYYVAARDGVYEVNYAEGLDWIIAQNRNLSASKKIRVVSVSAAPGEAGTPSSGNQKKWDDACARAKAAGILVLDCTSYRGFIGPCWYDAGDPENVAKCTRGFPGLGEGKLSGRILAPSSPRTTAEEHNKGEFGYRYCGRGGLSWSIPYCAGVLAMGWQVRPDIGPEQMRELLFQSAYTNKNGAKIIYPKKFIGLVSKAKTTRKAPRTNQ